MNSRQRIFFIAGLLCITGMSAVSAWFVMKPVPLEIQGEVDARQVDVATKIAGRIGSILVREGESVDKDQLLIILDSPEMQARLKQANAAMDAANAVREKAYTGSRKEEIEAARNIWEKSRAAVELAEKTYQRVNSLYKDGVIPEQKLDEADAGLKAARETAKAAKATYDMAREGARREDKEAASAMADKAVGAVSEVEAYMQETRLKAPLGGEISEITAEAGELVSPGYPILSIVDLSDVWVTFNMREDILSNIRMGKVFSARIPALGNKKVDLKVNYIAALGAFATWNATKASGDFDLKTFEVRAVPVTPVPDLRPGMSVIVTWDESEQLS